MTPSAVRSEPCSLETIGLSAISLVIVVYNNYLSNLLPPAVKVKYCTSNCALCCLKNVPCKEPGGAFSKTGCEAIGSWKLDLNLLVNKAPGLTVS